MPLDEPRTAFDPASWSPSNPAEESGSPPPSGKRQIGESRGEAAWRHLHQVKEWFAHIDDRKVDIMMSRLDRSREQTKCTQFCTSGCGCG
jgi:hypothetical protein